MLDDLLLQIEALETLPFRGSIPEQLGRLGIEDYRQGGSPYRVVYRVMGSTIFILVIADGRRDLQRLLEQRLLQRGAGSATSHACTAQSPPPHEESSASRTRAEC